MKTVKYIEVQVMLKVTPETFDLTNQDGIDEYISFVNEHVSRVRDRLQYMPEFVAANVSDASDSL